MKMAIAGQALTLAIPLSNESGLIKDAISYTAVVYDHEGTEILRFTGIAIPPDSDSFEVTIPASTQTSAQGASPLNYRILKAEVTTVTGVVQLEDVEWVNAGGYSVYETIATVQEATVIAAMLPEGQGTSFLAMNVAGRGSILAASAASLRSLPLYIKSGVYRGRNFRSIAEAEWSDFVADPKGAEFYAVARKAVVMESAAFTNMDSVTTARESGIISITVGESSQFFGSAKPLSTLIGYSLRSKEAMALLSPWLDYSVKIGRA